MEEGVEGVGPGSVCVRTSYEERDISLVAVRPMGWEHLKRASVHLKFIVPLCHINTHN